MGRTRAPIGAPTGHRELQGRCENTCGPSDVPARGHVDLVGHREAALLEIAELDQVD